MTTFSILPLGGFISVSLSMSYIRENKKAQRQKLDALRQASDFKNGTDTWRNVPENSPHGARHMFKSLEAAALMLRMGSETLRRAMCPVEHKHFYDTLTFLEQRTQLCSSYLDKTIVIEGPQGCGVSTLIKNLTSTSTITARESSPEKWNGILDLRQKLRGLPLPLLTAYESVCDYCRIVDAQDPVEDCSDSEIVFVERLYHSRVSQILCDNEHEDPSVMPDSAFQWPKDLPLPALVIYMVLPQEERGQRSGQKPIPPSEYNKIQLVHSRVRGVEFVAVDASGNEEDVLETVLQCCESHGVYLRKVIKSPRVEPTIDCTVDDKNQNEDSDEGDHPILINLSDAPLPPRHGGDDRRQSNKRQSMGWYGAFMSAGGD